MQEHGHTQEDIARGVGKSRSHVATPQAAVAARAAAAAGRDGRLSAGHARRC
ncbi:MAG: hypothetical protein U1E43_00310 [Rhodospirillales bacterium]